MRIQLSDKFTYKKLLAFVAPPIVMMVFTSIYSVVDGLFVSNFAGADAVAAINYIFPLIMILGSIGFMLGSGGSALVSKTMGEGNKQLANEYFSLLVYFTAAAGIVIMVAGQFAVPACSALLCHQSEGKIYDYCVIYGRILLAGQPFFILQNIFQSFFVTAEKPKLGLIVTAGAGLMNMVLDALFVAGLKWGLEGAAWATFSSQVFGGVVPLFYFGRKNDSLLKLTGTKFYPRAILKSAANGSSEFMSNVSVSIIIMLYNEQVYRFAGNTGVAAYAAIGYVSTIFFSMFTGFAVGVTPVIGYNFGAQNREELKSVFKKTAVITAASCVLMAAVAEGLAVPLVKMFNYDPEVAGMTLRGHCLFSIGYLFGGFGVLGSALFTALNNGLVSAVISFSRTLVLRVAFVLLLPLAWGIDGVWISYAFSELAGLLITAGFVLAFGRRYGYI